MSSAAAQPVAKAGRGRPRYRFLRRLSLTGAFLLLIVNPLLNYHFGITFVQGWYQSLGIGELRITSPLEGLESQLVTRQLATPTLIGMTIPLLLAFSWAESSVPGCVRSAFSPRCWLRSESL